MGYYRDDRFDNVLLEDSQRELLGVMVEAQRRVPKDRRQKFLVSGEMGTALAPLIHEGLPADFPGVYEGDLEALANEQMLSVAHAGPHTPAYDVTPRGFKYYEILQLEKGTPVERVETSLRSYIDAPLFEARHSVAFAKWKEAERLLWSGDAASSLTAVGHHCRESLQEFLESLGRLREVPLPKEKKDTVDRLRAIVAAKPPGSETVAAHAKALVAYLGTLHDLVQRQEHGGQREKAELQWEDSRRLVFLTLVALVEIDRVFDAHTQSS
jgi:hypothetical protein